MDYNLERYNELKEIIEKKEFDKIGELRDYPIIKNSDLKDKLLETYMEIPLLETEEEVDNILGILASAFGYNKIAENKKIVLKILQNYINVGIFIDSTEMANFNISNEELEDLTTIFMEKIKDPNYQIKNLPKEFKENEKFINYCLENKNLSILNFIEYKEEYLEKALQLIKEGYGINLWGSAKEEYKNKLIRPLIEAGYLENLDFIEDEQEIQELVPIIKEHIRNGKKLTITHNYKTHSFKDDQELMNLLIDMNQLDFVDIFSNKELEPYMEKIIQKVKEGYQFERIGPLITNSEFLKVLLETNQLKYINNCDKEVYEDNLDLFKKKLKEGIPFKLTNLSKDALILKTIKEDKELLGLLTENNLENLLIIMEYINHHENLLNMYNEEFYQTVKIPLAKEYHLNLEHLDQFVNRFGPKYLYYLENDNLKTAINLEEEDFNKYMSLFSYDKLNITNAQNIYDSILQARFKKEHEIDINRLTRIKNSLIEPNLPVPLEDLTILANAIDINTIKKLKIIPENELDQFNQNPQKFLIDIYTKIKNKEDVDKNLTIIYEINRQYLRKKREEYRKNNHYEKELKLDYTYDENSLLNILIADLVSSLTYSNEIISIDDLYNTIEYYHLENLNSISNPNEENIEKIKECVLFLKSKGQEFNTKETKQNITKLKEILRYMIKDEKISSNIKTQIKYSNYDVKKIYHVSHDDFPIFSILQEINPKELQDTVFYKEEAYQALKSLLQKYKFPEWQGTFKESLEKSNLSLESYDIAAMITKFNEIYKYMEEKKAKKEEINLPEIINYANVLSSSSNRYEVLLGKENAKVIKLNPNPNAATVIGDSNSRLDRAVENLVRLYQRKEITTPPINEDILVNGKKLNINLGNFTNPINITYGERTKSCMRIMGVGESLYNFCQENENAFHIRLTDSQTGKFISRVSGFRNGNSIFLNELRYSVEKDLYSDEEVIDAIKQVAQMLIEKSKESPLPIENVFITDHYAMKEDKTSKTIEIKENIQENLPTFHFDLRGSGIVLATTSQDRDYVKINTDKTNLPKYRVLRDNIREYQTKEEISTQLNKFHLLNQMITKNNPAIYQECELIPPEQTENIIYLLSGEDWIAYLDTNLQIQEAYIPRDDDRIMQELNTAKEILNKKKEEYQRYEATNRSNYRI